MKQLISIILLLIFCRNSFATPEYNKPFVPGKENQFKLTKCIVPVSLFTIGALGVPNKTIPETIPTAKNVLIDDMVACFNPAVYFCLGFSKNNINNKFLAASTTYISTLFLTTTLKYIINEPRPSFDSEDSFPSRHAAIAFAGAEMIRLECGYGYGALAYLIAGNAAFLRYHHNNHWINDLFGGAGIGILSANIGYWLLPTTNSLFHKDKKKDISFFPIYRPNEKTIAFSISTTID